jgi:hypothetical protein
MGRVALDTLEHRRKGGRISPAWAAIGTPCAGQGARVGGLLDREAGGADRVHPHPGPRPGADGCGTDTDR